MKEPKGKVCHDLQLVYAPVRLHHQLKRIRKTKNELIPAVLVAVT